jgi:hypothetical protein
VPVGWAQAQPERGAPAVDHNVALRARSSAISRVRAGLIAPLLAGTELAPVSTGHLGLTREA